MVFNKWNDKNSGEEKKQYKVRMLKLMTQDVFNEFAQALDLENEYSIQNQVENITTPKDGIPIAGGEQRYQYDDSKTQVNVWTAAKNAPPSEETLNRDRRIPF